MSPARSPLVLHTTASRLARQCGRLIRQRSSIPNIQLAIILGSGFTPVRNLLADPSLHPYATLPGFPKNTVPGHEGCLFLGLLNQIPTAIFSGRFHLYEGRTPLEITFPVRVAHELGASILLLTNAAGGIRPSFLPGQFLSITDHINLMGINPLAGAPSTVPNRFVDMTTPYDRELASLMRAAGKKAGVRINPGTYLAVPGPSYETPAEIRAFARLGADAVGMSTVPEVILARALGLRVAGLSCITNKAAGLGATPLSHEDVLEIGGRSAASATRLIQEFTRRLSSSLAPV